jgi:hypothetical protein
MPGICPPFQGPDQGPEPAEPPVKSSKVPDINDNKLSKGLQGYMGHTGCGLASRNLTFVVSQPRATRRSFTQINLRPHRVWFSFAQPDVCGGPTPCYAAFFYTDTPPGDLRKAAGALSRRKGKRSILKIKKPLLQARGLAKGVWVYNKKPVRVILVPLRRWTPEVPWGPG